MSNKLLPSLAGGVLLAFAAAAGPIPGATLAAQTDAPRAEAAALPSALIPLFDGISLSDEQLRQAAVIHKKHGGAIGAMPKKGAPSDSAKSPARADAVDHRVEEAKELRAMLTPDQQKVFDRNLEQVKADWGKPAGY